MSDVTPDGIPRPDPAAVAAQPKRLTRWDRPRPPRDWQFWVGGTGRVLMTLGILMFGFVAYQLWGTGIEYRQNQNSLEREFERTQASLLQTTTPSTTAPGTIVPGSTSTSVPTSSTVRGTTTTSTAAPVTTQLRSLWPQVALGDVIAIIDIPKIDKTVYAVAGIRTNDLKQGLGHYPETPLPGQFGNVAFAGHRTTYGAPLFDVDSLVAGDEIIITTLTSQLYVYRMVGEAQIVSPSEYSVIRDADPTKATLTLTSCHPRYSAKQRIVIKAELDVALSSPIQFATPYYGRTPDPPTPDDGLSDDNVVSPPDEAGPDAESASADPELFEGGETLTSGWFSDSGAFAQVALWGAIVALVGLGAYLLSRRTRHYWVGIVVGFLPFLLTLYFLYQNVNRLLPPDL